MAHYWAVYGFHPAESEQKFRLDPCHLPQSICYKSPRSGQYRSAFLTERGIFLREYAAAERSACPQPQSGGFSAADNKLLHIFSPRQFRGIAAARRSAAGGTGQQTRFGLLLLHDNPDYSIPLLLSAHKDDVVLDWRLWADIYNLPMLVMEEDSSIRPLGGHATLKMFINQGKSPAARDFSLRCRGLSLNTRLVLANQVMLG